MDQGEGNHVFDALISNRELSGRVKYVMRSGIKLNVCFRGNTFLTLISILYIKLLIYKERVIVYIRLRLLANNYLLSFKSNFFIIIEYRYIRYLYSLLANISLYN